MRLPSNPARRVGVLAVAVAAVGAVTVAGTPAYAAPDNTRLGTKLAREVTVNGVNRHLIAFQRIAEQNGGTRASGTPGYDASATYVHDKLAAAGLDVEYQEFEFPYFQENAPAELDRISPSPQTFVPGEEVVTYDFSGSGEVTGTVQAVDLEIPPGPLPTSSTSGCQAEDFAGFTAGNIALIQRGTCTFQIKVTNAIAAGAAAVIIFNEGQEGRTDPFAGDIGIPVDIPVVGISFAEGAEFADLIAAGPVVARVETSTESETRTTRNVIAETPGGRADNVVMAGAHLDSVPAGPGINDNGTGTAALLELGLKLADERVRNKVRLAFWGAEEAGLLGSEYYVAQLSFEQQLDIALYLNFDMIGSPNFARFVYDGDDSDGVGAGPGPFGSAQIEALFTGYFDSRSLPSEGTDFSGRSDYGPFIAVGIPSGGLFTGAEGIKTPEQAARYGGTAGIAYDPCYHAACDNLGNINRTALDQNGDAVAFAVGRYALDTSDINGVGAKSAQASAAARKAKAERLAKVARTAAKHTHSHEVAA
jgi:Zn-dependent M28 family amino/carboxypeptidase